MLLCIDLAAYYSSQMRDDSWNITCQLNRFSLQKIGKLTVQVLMFSLGLSSKIRCYSPYPDHIKKGTCLKKIHKIVRLLTLVGKPSPIVSRQRCAASNTYLLSYFFFLTTILESLTSSNISSPAFSFKSSTTWEGIVINKLLPILRSFSLISISNVYLRDILKYEDIILVSHGYHSGRWS